MSRSWNPEQASAIEREGRVFVSAGAGTGKTAVLVERVLRRLDAGTAIDRILVITFTERAASELKQRVREALITRGDAERARQVDSAWISTIHRFCMRLLHAHAIEAGLDPRFAVADEVQSRILQSEAFDLALEGFLAEPGERRLDLLAAYSRGRLRQLLVEAFERLRSAGAEPALRAHREPDTAAAVDAARAAAAELDHEDAGVLVAFLDSQPAVEELRDLSRFAIRDTDRFKRYNAARRDLENAARDVTAVADLELLDELLQRFQAAYRELRDRRSLVDFADLELRGRDLLRALPEVALSYRERFAEVMVDEFQDTNRLQCELIDQVAGDRLFLVGDEFQSIYRFRHADVEVYREQRAAAGPDVVDLVRNYRSRPHVLGMVNELYRRTFGDRYAPLVAEAGGDDGPPPDDRVELLLVDKPAHREAGLRWRETEAQGLAERIAELVAGGVLPGQVVLLFEAGTDAAIYERALRGHHLRTVRTTGRGYYAQQQVADLLGYLRLLRNRYDDMALLTVLASPLVGIGNDGLLAVRQAAVKRPIFTAFERDELPEGLSVVEQRLASAFAQRFSRLVARSADVGLERLIELIVSEHDYDLACLALPDGDRRYANVVKLGRLAGDYEALRGPDLEGFIGFCAEQAALAAREGEAATAEEDQDAVVLMTIHAAKGLEFEVVVLADTGRERAARAVGDILVDGAGRVALRAPDPVTGAMRPALGFAEVAETERTAESEEARRLQYVALTRARRHLLVSGALDMDEDTTIAHICRTLGVGLTGPGDADVGDARLRLHVIEPPAGDAAPRNGALPALAEPEVGRQLELFSEGGRNPVALPALTAPPQPPPVAVHRLSYSALALYRRCGYRYFAQRVLGLPEPEIPREEGAGLDPLQLGDAVHLELERADGRWRTLYPHATAEDGERVEGFLANWQVSEIAGELATLAEVRREVPFSFEVDGVLFRGRLDVMARPDPESALIVDYKTNRLSEKSVEEVVDASYGVQVTTYAVAALRGGARRVRIAYAFLERPQAIVVREFSEPDRGRLEGELSDAIAQIRGGRFPARPGPHCVDCPALDLLCAGPRLEWDA